MARPHQRVVAKGQFLGSPELNPLTPTQRSYKANSCIMIYTVDLFSHKVFVSTLIRTAEPWWHLETPFKG